MDQYRKTIRADFIDYDDGDFFITICTKNKLHYFGEIRDGVMHISEIGQFCNDQIDKANSFNNQVDIITHIVMPNHVHAIVHVETDGDEIKINETDTNKIQRAPNPSLRANADEKRHVTKLSKYVNSLKGKVTKYANARHIEFGWQPRYNDHFIRDSRDYSYIYDYIVDNVARWSEDRYNK